MNDAEADTYRAVIEARLEALRAEDARGAPGLSTVELDQQSVGRLSRMDALQNQAMAKAAEARRAQERMRLKAALARLDEGEFGFCEDCGDEIGHARLDLDPTVRLCFDCARG